MRCSGARTRQRRGRNGRSCRSRIPSIECRSVGPRQDCCAEELPNTEYTEHTNDTDSSTAWFFASLCETCLADEQLFDVFCSCVPCPSCRPCWAVQRREG